MVVSAIRDAVDQLDSPAITKLAEPKHQDADFDTFKSVAQSIIKQEGESANSTDAVCSQLDESFASDSLHTPQCSKGQQHDPPLTAEGGRRFVSPKDFELLKVIGMGAFGKVLQVRNKRSKQVLAMKVISKRLLRRKGDGVIENVLAERNILRRVRHPFVVQMHCSFQSREKLFIIMDFLAGGELFLRLGREGIFLEKTAAFYLAEIILALDHLHNLGVLHRDLKPENILLGVDGHVCLTDFGLAKDFSGTGGFNSDDDEARARTVCGTSEYMAPEMVARQGYGRSADYWSLGCIAYEMLSGRPPFESKQGAKVLFSKIMTEKVKMPSGSSAAACKLLKGLLNRDVQARLGAARSTMFEVGGVAGLQKAEFFTDINWDKLACKQIAPPAVFSVNNDGDVQHFHEEFTQMALPRSVLDMSSEDFHPHRVDSKTFRGFSFIQDDFLLPERGDVEDQSYWESIQEDGESVSDCASSKMGEIEAAQQACQSSAKRPPRKRKKKPADIPGSITSTPAGTAANTPFASASNTPVASNTNTPEPSEAGYLPEKLDALEINESALPKMIIDITTNKMSSSTTSTQINVQNNTTSQAEPSVPTVSTSVPRQLKPVRETWQVTKKLDNPARPKQRNNINQNTYQKITLGQGAAAGATPQTSRANMQTISSSSANQKATPACQWSTARATPHANRAATQQTSVSLYGVGPKQISQGTTNRLSMQQQNGWDTGTGASQPVRANPHSCTRTDPAGTALPLAPSSDWRNHQMSPRDVDGRPVVQNIVPTVWPSLGGPPLNPNAPTPSKKPPTNLKGAWAAKVGKS